MPNYTHVLVSLLLVGIAHGAAPRATLAQVSDDQGTAAPTASPQPLPIAAPAADTAPQDAASVSPSPQTSTTSVSPTQHAARLSPPPPPGAAPRHATGPRNPDPPVAAASSDDKDERKEDEDPMGWFGLTLKIGIANIDAGRIDNPVYNAKIAEAAARLPPALLKQYGLTGSCTPIDKKCRTPARTGVHIAATLHFGGDGLGWDVEPYVSTASDAVAVGAYMGPKFDIHIVDPLYFGFGFGFKAAYVSADGWKHGGDIFGRIPAHLTYYLTRDLALTLEGSFGAGISMLVSEPMPITDPRTGERVTSVPKLGIGAARAFEFTAGVRFP